MVNRLLLIGTGVILGAGCLAFAQIRNVEAARANPETVIALGAEEASGDNVALAATPHAGTVIYACPDGRAFAVSYDAPGRRAALTIDGDTFMLEPVFVAQGVQFTDGHYNFRAEGEMAAVILGEEVVQENCQVSHDATAQAAADLKGHAEAP